MTDEPSDPRILPSSSSSSDAREHKERKRWNRTVFDDAIFSPRMVIRVSDGAGIGGTAGKLEYLVEVGADNAKEPDEQKRLVRLDREDFKVLLDAQRTLSAAVVAGALNDENIGIDVVGRLEKIVEQLDPEDDSSLAYKLLAALTP